MAKDPVKDDEFVQLVEEFKETNQSLEQQEMVLTAAEKRFRKAKTRSIKAFIVSFGTALGSLVGAVIAFVKGEQEIGTILTGFSGTGLIIAMGTAPGIDDNEDRLRYVQKEQVRIKREREAQANENTTPDENVTSDEECEPGA